MGVATAEGSSADRYRELRRLDWLHRLAQTVSHAVGLDEVYAEALDCLQHTLGADRASILLLDDIGVMRFCAWRGLSDDYRRAVEGQPPWPPSATDADVIVVEDATSDPRLEDRVSVFAREEIRAFAFIPLTQAGRLIGRFVVYFREIHRLSDADLALARTVAAHVAFAVAQRRTEQRLRNSMEELDVILEGVGDAIAVHDPHGVITFANTAAAKLCGRERGDELISRSVDELLSCYDATDEEGVPLERDGLPDRIASASGEASNGQVVLRPRAGGDSRTVQITSTPIHDEKGAFRFVIDILRDVTTRRRTERAAELLAAVASRVSQTVDVETTIRQVAHALIPKLADGCMVVVRAEGHGWRRAFAHVDPRHQAEVERALAKDEVSSCERLVELAEGHGRGAHLVSRELLPFGEALAPTSTMAAVLRISGCTVGCIASFHDVSGRRYESADAELLAEVARRVGLSLDNAVLFEAERRARADAEAAAERTARLQAVAAALSAVATTERAAAVAIREAQLAVGVAAAAMVVSRELDRLRVIAAEGFERGQDLPASARDPVTRAMLNLELTVAPAEPGHGVDEWVAIPLPDEGKATGVLILGLRMAGGLVPDEHELLLAIGRQAGLAIAHTKHLDAVRRSEERARAAYLAAKEAERRKDEFLAILGHELRNPLAPIVTALQLMELRDDPSARRERLIIARQVQHLLCLVDDLLDVSRITRGKLDLQRELVDVADTVAKAVELASPLLEQRNHELLISVPAGELAVEGDPVRLAQVISNLVNNAAKYTEPGGRIEIGAKRVDDRVTIEVTDNGMGIDEQLLPQMFDLFTQAPQSLDRSGGGLGLGLTIVRRLVELHGGSIEARSEGRNKGATFTVSLPVAGTPRERAVLESPRTRAGARVEHERRVLVVDDNPDAAEMLSEVLRARGYATAIAHDGPGALLVAESFRPEVGLLDIGLPVMDGYELAQHLRRGPGGDTMHLIAITGYGQLADQERARVAGFDAHFVKPVRLEQLIAAVEAGRPDPIDPPPPRSA